MSKAIVLVLDSLGIGASADAALFGDSGADTLRHIAEACARGEADGPLRRGPLSLPNLGRLGLGAAAAASGDGPLPGNWGDAAPSGAFGHAREQSSGKDTPSGHWEMMGVPVLFDWGYFEKPVNSFPPQLLADLIERAGLPGILGNCHASGTTVLDELGEAHIRSKQPICYTSADSVMQIAAHESHFGLEALYRVCEIARTLCDEYTVGRVIARPFTGEHAGEFRRTGNRRDYTVPPPSATLLDHLCDAGGTVHAVGKIGDIFAHRGISRLYKADGNDALFDATLKAYREAPDNSLVFANFVDFDMLYGHRRDLAGYAAALEAFDRRLPELLALMDPQTLLVISADHGCDPSRPGSDHTREYVPVLAYGAGVAAGWLGERESFADIGQTVAMHLGLGPLEWGNSFLLDQAVDR
ncbi:phosphopentomutase [Pseudomonas sp. CBSPBW29]|uniref:phosphopentomutase n=1 Tax=Pseudomonas TaxID=286 RepID=UPI0021AC50F3|nr:MULTISPECIES: phosphopentomutase [unclassified Pseudomonas]WEL43349.1 phosphopentomutase [Pseudomonas sp. CBSPBW29]WEL64420.1 phosphopentomutase [Pseudomonas sp. CBSPGW29]WEL73599.1 phosphopentomutase [Pseudomonas sp. CBSPCGW29]WEL74910.1 phosphopentomutase [Pseudomonas sp. CBSPAW29]WEL80849.1 phosphopentomutase [Pseudomonas sp. CBSPCAW29]WEL89360.1 phosphopentomutase [Pseudomonas sp. CBSPCBW29]